MGRMGQVDGGGSIDAVASEGTPISEPPCPEVTGYRGNVKMSVANGAEATTFGG
jgi:hypothetical protein